MKELTEIAFNKTMISIDILWKPEQFIQYNEKYQGNEVNAHLKCLSEKIMEKLFIMQTSRASSHSSGIKNG